MFKLVILFIVKLYARNKTFKDIDKLESIPTNLKTQNLKYILDADKVKDCTDWSEEA